MKNFYIADDIQIPIFFSFQTILWLTLIGAPIAIILRIIHDIVSKNKTKKYENTPLVSVAEDSVTIFYKSNNVVISYKDITMLRSWPVGITRFIYGGQQRGFGFALETSNKTYGKLIIKTNNKRYVIKYVEYVNLAKEVIYESIKSSKESNI